MSSPSGNAFASSAQVLVSQGSLQQPAILFQQAVANVKKRQSMKQPRLDLFLQLNTATTEENILKILMAERSDNIVWKERSETSAMERVSRIADNILRHKESMSLMVSNDQIAGPVWGSISFSLSILQDILKTKDLLAEIQQTLVKSAERFGEYFSIWKDVDGSLKTAFVAYYELVIEFAIDVLEEFQRANFRLAIAILQRRLKGMLEHFSINVKELRDDVDKGFYAKSVAENKIVLEDIKAIHANPQRFSIISHTKSSQTTAQIRHNLPQNLSSTFTGRQRILSKIWSNLQKSSDVTQVQIALWGIGGVGKTQIVLKYAHDRIKDNSYQHIFFMKANNKNTVDNEVLALAYLLGLCDPALAKDAQYALVKVKDWFRGNKEWLLILDNVQDFGDVGEVLPNADHGHILLTIRNKLVAPMLSRPNDANNAIEVLPMEDDEGEELARRLSESSSFEADKTSKVHKDVSRFASNLPLGIEQLIHNSIFFGRPLANTLTLVNNKVTLLKQQNISSLHESNMSVGGIIAQTLDDLEKSNECAASLFRVLCYMEPSSIPVRIIREGAAKLSDHLHRQSSFDRGQIRRGNQAQLEAQYDTDVNRPSSFFDYSSLSKKSWQRLLRIGEFNKRYSNTMLPRDKTQEDIQLETACRPSKSLGRLFGSKNNIEDAIKTLLGVALIRMISNDEIWIHDLFSELGRTTTECKSKVQTQILAQAAATLVFLSYPIPNSPSTIDRNRNCWFYFPHGVTCHSHLRNLGILNKSVLGPELSHLIASTLHEKQPFEVATKFKKSDLMRRSECTAYYRDALVGYATAVKRLRSIAGVDETGIILSTFADYVKEDQLGYLPYRYLRGNERFGRSALWRYLQTMAKLATFLGEEEETRTEAVKLFRKAIDGNIALFGFDKHDTITLKEALTYQYFLQEDWESAYKLTENVMNNIVVWDDEAKTYLLCRHGSYTGEVALWMNLRARCCLNLDGKGAEAVWWLKHVRKYQTIAYGEWDCCQAITMHQLGRAYNKLGKPAETFYWYGSAITCYINRLGTEMYDPSNDLGYFSLHFQQEIHEAIDEYKKARAHLEPVNEKWMETMDVAVESAISAWNLFEDAHALVSLNWEFIESEATREAQLETEQN